MHFFVGELRAAQRAKADNIGALPDKADFVRPGIFPTPFSEFMTLEQLTPVNCRYGPQLFD
jgi:hypothetical protein